MENREPATKGGELNPRSSEGPVRCNPESIEATKKRRFTFVNRRLIFANLGQVSHGLRILLATSASRPDRTHESADAWRHGSTRRLKKNDGSLSRTAVRFSVDRSVNKPIGKNLLTASANNGTSTCSQAGQEQSTCRFRNNNTRYGCRRK